MSEETAKQELAKRPPAPLATDEFDILMDESKLAQAWRVASILAKSNSVPAHYRGKPEDCLLAFVQAKQLNYNASAFMQKTYVIGGKIGMEATMMIGLVNTRGPFKDNIDWVLEGTEDKPTKCTAYAINAKTGKRCEISVTWDMVVKEGWDKKPGSKWNTLPGLMMRYRSAAFLARLYCPEVLYGMVLQEELEETIDETGNPVKKRPVSSLEERLSKPVESTTTDSPVDVPQKQEVEPAIDAGAEKKELDGFCKPVVAAKEVMFEEFQYYCVNCGAEFDTTNKTKNAYCCPNCDSNNIVNRKK